MCSLELTCSLEAKSELKYKVQLLKEKLPDPCRENEGKFRKWWETHGQSWVEKFRIVMIEHRNVGHDWRLSEQQKELLRQYYDANKLLVDCLNSDCYISRAVREEIENLSLH